MIDKEYNKQKARVAKYTEGINAWRKANLNEYRKYLEEDYRKEKNIRAARKEFKNTLKVPEWFNENLKHKASVHYKTMRKFEGSLNLFLSREEKLGFDFGESFGSTKRNLLAALSAYMRQLGLVSVKDIAPQKNYHKKS